MAKSRATPRSGQSPDPYLRTFLRQAVAIIASERGLNDISQPKLQALAKQLGLSDSAYATALETLKERNPAMGLNRYEKKFVELISNEMKKISGDVLTIKAENKVIDLAERKYQIPPIRAHQLVEETARRYDVGTISHHEAEMFATTLIDEAVNDRTWLRDPDQQRLLHACQKWGMAKREIESAINVRLIRNRKRRTKKTISSFAAFSGIGLLVAALIYGGLQIDWGSVFPSEDKSNNNTADFVAEPTNPSKLPGWLTPELQEKIELASVTDRRLQSLFALAPWTDLNRTNTYQSLTQLAFTYSKPNEPLNDLVGELYSNDPDHQVALALLDSVKSSMAALDQARIMTPAKLREAFAANQVLAGLATATNQENENAGPRLEPVGRFIDNFYGVDMATDSQDELALQVEKQLIQKSWRFVLSHSEEQPRAAIGLLPELEQRSTQQQNAVTNAMRTNVVFNLLNNTSTDWREIRLSIKNSIAFGDFPTSTQWIEKLEHLSNQSQAQFIASELATRLNLSTQQSHASLVRELRKVRTINRFRAYSPEMEAATKVDDFVRQVENELAAAGFRTDIEEFDISKSAIPELLLKLTAANNTALNWIRSAKQKDYSGFAAQLARARKLSSATEKSLAAIRSSPTPFEKRQFKESIEKLENAGNDQSFGKISAVESLVKIAPKFQEIAYDDATVLARLILETTDQRVALAFERALPHFSNWSNLLLAISDRLLGSSAPDFEAFLEPLQNLGFRPGPSRLDRNQLHAKLLQHVAKILNEQYRESISLNRWSDVAPRFAQLQKQRVTFLAHELASRNQSAVESTLQGIVRTASHGQDDRQWLVRSVELGKAISTSEIERLVAGNQILAQSLVDTDSENTVQQKPLRKLLTQNPPLNQGARLLVSEMILMNQLSSFREQWLEKIAE